METNNNEFKFITAEEAKRISDNNDKNLSEKKLVF